MRIVQDVVRKISLSENKIKKNDLEIKEYLKKSNSYFKAENYNLLC